MSGQIFKMSAPVVAQVDTINAGQGGGVSFQYGESEPGIIKRSFRRVYEHYAENNMTATGYTESLDGSSQVTAWQLDEGWHLIPYWNPGIAMTQHDLAQMHALGEGIRIDRMGFKVVNAQMFRTDVTAISGVTEISNRFLDNPWWETYVDSSHNFEGMVVPAATAIATPNTVGYPVMLSNDNMKAQEVISFAAGLLPRAKWSYNRAAATPYAKMTQDQHRERSGTADSIFGTHSTLNAGGRQAISTDGFMSFGHEWVNKDGGAWYPFNLPNDTTIWTSLKDYTNGINAVFPNSRANVLNGAASSDSVGVVRRGTNLENIKHNRWAKMDLHTLTPLPQQDVPEDCFIKIQRMHDISSPMRLAGRLLIEYYCDVSIIPSTDFYMGPHSFGGGSGATTIEGRTQQNERTNGMLRKWRVWGIPAIPIPATGGSSIISGTIHYPPWTPFTSPGDLDGTPTPFAGFVTDWPNDDDTNGLFYKPPLELATIRITDTVNTTNTLFCLTETWDGDPPTVEFEVRDSRRVNNVVHPALTAFRTASGIPPLVWALESLVDFQDINTREHASNPLHAWIGPSTPATNRLHLFADPVAAEDARSLKRRRVEEVKEQDIESE